MGILDGKIVAPTIDVISDVDTGGPLPASAKIAQIVESRVPAHPAPRPNSVGAKLLAFVQHWDTGKLAREVHEIVSTVDPDPDEATAFLEALELSTDIAKRSAAPASDMKTVGAGLFRLKLLAREDGPLWIQDLSRTTVACQLACHAFDVSLVQRSLIGDKEPRKHTPAWIVDQVLREDFSKYAETCRVLVDDEARNAAPTAEGKMGELTVSDWKFPIHVGLQRQNGKYTGPSNDPRMSGLVPRGGRLDILDVLLYTIRRSPSALGCAIVKGNAGISAFQAGNAPDVQTSLNDAGYRQVKYQPVGDPKFPGSAHPQKLAEALRHLREAKGALGVNTIVIAEIDADFSVKKVREAYGAASDGSPVEARDLASLSRANRSGHATQGAQIVIMNDIRFDGESLHIAYTYPHNQECVSFDVSQHAFLRAFAGYYTARA